MVRNYADLLLGEGSDISDENREIVERAQKAGGLVIPLTDIDQLDSFQKEKGIVIPKIPLDLDTGEKVHQSEEALLKVGGAVKISLEAISGFGEIINRSSPKIFPEHHLGEICLRREISTLNILEPRES